MGPGAGGVHLRARDALKAADNMLLFRTATRQICRRMGYFATFMCRPETAGLLFERLASAPVADRCAERAPICSCRSATASSCRRVGQGYLAGLLEHAVPATVFATPTVNGYRRFRPNSLAPDRATWGYDHRGVDAARARRRWATRQPGWRTGSASRRPIPICTSPRRSPPGSTASTASSIRRRRDDEPYTAECGRCCRRV